MAVGIAVAAPDRPLQGPALRGPGFGRTERLADQSPAVAVTRLDLTDYRNIHDLRLETEAKVVILSGPNGAGKTNVLEALSLLSPGRGLRRARLADVPRRGGAGIWAVAARVRHPRGMVEVGTGVVPDRQIGDRRLVKIDGQAARGTAALGRALTMNWLTPPMDRLFVDGPGPRRRFLDRLVYGFDADHAARVSAYDRTLRERSRLLRDGRRDAAWLGALEETMAGHGIAVAAARRETISRLRSGMKAGVAPFPAATVAADGDVERWLDVMPAVDAEGRLRAALEAARDCDARSGGAAVGPHRTDLAVRHAGKDLPAESCSTGEQKALLVSIVLADARLREARLGRAPLLLFDEVAAHLDATRREALFELLIDRSAQTWITGTDRSLFDGLGPAARRFGVDDGRISASPE